VPQFRQFITTFAFIISIFVATAISAKADPLTFSNAVALQNNGMTRVDLLSNPGVTIFGPQISFLVDIQGTVPVGGTSLLRITYTEAGGVPIVQTFSIPAFDTVFPPYSQLFTINSPGATFQGIPATLTISILGPPGFSLGPGPGQFMTHTYSFIVAQPVPEPVSLILFGTGVLGLWRKVSQRRRQGTPH